VLGKVQFLLRETGNLFAISLEGLRKTFDIRHWWKEYLRQCWFIAKVCSLPSILIAIPFGAVIALHVGTLNRQLGAESATGAAMVLAIVREASPVATALLIAGVGTHTLEVLQEQPRIDAIIVPIGGGSGAAGACIAAKAINPQIEVIGVQSEQAPAAYLSWKSGELDEAPNRTRAEGLSTATPFELPQRILRRMLDDFVLVSDDELDLATLVMIEKTRNLVEAAGAAALAGALKLRERLKGRSVALICSGGNISPAQLRELLT